MKNPTHAINLNFVPLRYLNIKSYLLADGKCSLLKKQNDHVGYHTFLSDHSVSIWCLIDGTRSIKKIYNQLQSRVDLEEVIDTLNQFHKLKLIKMGLK